ncbi:MAG: cyanoexosortase B, partial [Microcystaceae cyanobacterium]
MMQIRQKLSLSLEQKLFNLLLIVLLVILYAPIVIHWYQGWIYKNINIEHEYFSHGMIGFPYAAYL